LPPRGPRLHGRDARRHQPRDHHRNDDERPARRLGGARRPAGVLHPGGGRRGARHRPAGAARLHRAAARPPGLTLRADVLTIFPELFGGILAVGPLKRARELGVLEVSLHQLRDYAGGRHLQVDDVPYGGGQGMVMKPEPLVRAIEHVAAVEKPRRILLAARGARLDQRRVDALAREPSLLLVCGRYEGAAERVAAYVDEGLSIGDFGLSGGELAAAVVLDAVA